MKHLYREFVKYPKAKSLNEDQLKFAKIFFSGQNTFITGPGGVGKSYVIKVIFDFLNLHDIAIGKTATTGVAAVNIGGVTINSWAGLGLADKDNESLLNDVIRNKKARDRIANAKILFIDEVSMAGANMLDKINYIFKYIRNNSKPFGGIILTLSGDFLQLPFISRFGGPKDGYAFESKSWKEANFNIVYLNKLVRQSASSDFAKALNLIRVGDLSMIDTINSRIDAKFSDNKIQPVKLLCKNVDVDRFNNDKLAEINSKEERFYAVDTGAPYLVEYFNKYCLAPKVLSLKVGCQVMLLRNIDTENGYVNGSIGIVEAFTPEGPKVKFSNGTAIVSKESWESKEQTIDKNGKSSFKVLGSRTQIPLKLAYSVTIHKIMGMTLDRAEVDLNEAFGPSICYVALSRCRDLESLSIKKFPHSKIFVDDRCVEFYNNIQEPIIEDFKDEEPQKTETKENKMDHQFENVDL